MGRPQVGEDFRGSLHFSKIDGAGEVEGTLSGPWRAAPVQLQQIVSTTLLDSSIFPARATMSPTSHLLSLCVVNDSFSLSLFSRLLSSLLPTPFLSLPSHFFLFPPLLPSDSFCYKEVSIQVLFLIDMMYKKEYTVQIKNSFG